MFHHIENQKELEEIIGNLVKNPVPGLNSEDLFTFKAHERRMEFWDTLRQLFRLAIDPFSLSAWDETVRLVFLQIGLFFQFLYNRSRGNYTIDQFGYDAEIASLWQPFFNFLFEFYWRCEVTGLEHIPKDKPVLFIANHSGFFPWDCLMLKKAVHQRISPEDKIRSLVSLSYTRMPFLGLFLQRTGHTLLSGDNCRSLLQAGCRVIAFPEDLNGLPRRWNEPYRVRYHSKHSLLEAALTESATVIPVAVVGHREAYPMLTRIDWLGKFLGLPFLPITPQMGLGLPMGLLPLPTKWRISFIEVISSFEDDSISSMEVTYIHDLTMEIRAKIQREIVNLLKKRSSKF